MILLDLSDQNHFEKKQRLTLQSAIYTAFPAIGNIYCVSNIVYVNLIKLVPGCFRWMFIADPGLRALRKIIPLEFSSILVKLLILLLLLLLTDFGFTTKQYSA